MTLVAAAVCVATDGAAQMLTDSTLVPSSQLDTGLTATVVMDVNGDGTKETIVGTPNYDPSFAINSGRVVIFSGSSLFQGGQATFVGGQAYERLGWAIAEIPQVKINGVSVLAISSPGHNDGRGRVMLFDTLKLIAADPSAKICELTPKSNPHSGDSFGASLAVFNGASANQALLAVGIPYHDSSSSPYDDRGRVEIFAFDGNCPSAPVASLVGSMVAGKFGESMANVGDIDADGKEDLAVGAPEESANGKLFSGAVRVFNGQLWQEFVSPITATDLAQQSANFGFSLSKGGDTNADGRQEILIGEPFAHGSGGNNPNSGRAHLYGWVGTPGAWQRLKTFDVADDDAGFGWSLSQVGQTKGPYFAIGAPHSSKFGALHGGIFMFLGGSSSEKYNLTGGLGGLPFSSFGNGVFSALGFSPGGEHIAVASTHEFNSSLPPDLMTLALESYDNQGKAKVTQIGDGCSGYKGKAVKPTLSFKQAKLDKSTKCANDMAKCKPMKLVGAKYPKNSFAECWLGPAFATFQPLNADGCNLYVDKDHAWATFTIATNKKGKFKGSLVNEEDDDDEAFFVGYAHPSLAGLTFYVQCAVGGDPLYETALSPALKVLLETK